MHPHLHKYKFESFTANGHKHTLSGYTEGMMGIDSLHFHFFSGISSYSHHTHYYSGMTGLPIKTENGHKHKIEGILDQNQSHEHPYSHYSQEDTAFRPGGLKHEAYI